MLCPIIQFSYIYIIHIFCSLYMSNIVFAISNYQQANLDLLKFTLTFSIDRRRWPSYTPSTSTPPRSVFWSALQRCPNDVYKYNRQDCFYKNGLYFYSSRNRNWENENDQELKAVSKSRSMQAKIELAKFQTNWYRPGITGNNAIKL